MIGTVDRVEKSKSGKSWRVKIGPKYYGAGFDSQISGASGKSIDFNFEDGEFGPWIKSWAYAQDNPVPTSPQAPNSPQKAGLEEHELRFVSNVVGSAITAKTLTDPLQISVWAKAAAATVKEL